MTQSVGRSIGWSVCPYLFLFTLVIFENIPDDSDDASDFLTAKAELKKKAFLGKKNTCSDRRMEVKKCPPT